MEVACPPLWPNVATLVKTGGVAVLPAIAAEGLDRDRKLKKGGSSMNLSREYELLLTRRQLFGRTAVGIGTMALASLLNERLFAADRDPSLKMPGALPALHFAPKAKRVIYLFMSGGPSHIDLFDYKTKLKENHGKELPASVRMGQRVTGMTAFQKSFPCVAPMFQFAQHGRSGA